MKKKVAIDAKWYFEGPPSGKVVIRNLVDYLNLKENEFIFYFDKKHRNAPELRNIKGEVRFVWAGNNMLSNVFILPILALFHGADIILYQNFPSFLFWKRQIAYVHDIIYMTSPQFYSGLERIYFYPLKYLVGFAKDIVTVSDFEKNRMIQHQFGTGKRFHVVYHGVDTSFKPKEHQDPVKLAEIKTKYNLPDKFILFVGRLNVRKNVSSLLYAFKLVLEKRDDYKLVIVGGKDWKSLDIDRLIDDLDISKNLVLTGGIYGEELPLVYSLATIFCFPSFDESFGLPPLEAMAAGVPVVVSDRSSVPEICGEAALYFDPDNREQIAQQLLTLLSDEALRQKQSELGLLQASKFTWLKSTSRLIEIFNDNEYAEID